MRMVPIALALLALSTTAGAGGAGGAEGLPAVAQSAKGSPAVAQSAKAGVVRGVGHAFADDGGPFLARGASVMWALWGYQHDRARLGRNLQTLRDWGFDYIRVLGVVGAPGDRADDSWRDRRLDPGAADYDKSIAGLTDWAYREYGLRVQWSIFGGTDFAATPESRRAVVERFAAMAKGREQAIFAFEVANESFQNGFGGSSGEEELRGLAKILKGATPNLVALSSPPGSDCSGARALYQGSAADLLTLHLGRAGGEDDGHWRSLRQIWDMHACTGVPALMSSNEPIGPQSSVAAIEDPVAVAAMAFVTYGSGIGAFVFHSGPGVRGGGEADRRMRRHSDVWQLPTAPRIAAGLATLVRLLPGDFANWTQHDSVGDFPDPPFGAADKTAVAGLYCSSRGSDFACVAAGVKRPVSLTVRRTMSATVHDLVAGTGSARRLTAGTALELLPAPAAVLIRGRFE
jgi:hypothetical protein